MKSLDVRAEKLATGELTQEQRIRASLSAKGLRPRKIKKALESFKETKGE